MKDAIEIILFSSFGLWAILVPAIVLMKIKYLKTVRRKAFRGIEELFLFVNEEWWIAGLTWAFPILNKNKNPEINSMQRKANLRLYLLYTTVVIQLLLVGLLSKI